MRSATCIIHKSTADRSVIRSNSDLLLDVSIRFNGDLSLADDLNTEFGVVTHVQATFRSVLGLDQEILHLLIVNFDHT